MFIKVVSIFVLLESTAFGSTYIENEIKNYPLVMVVLLAHNKAHTLPHFLTYFNQLTYPKNRLALHIRADHSEDQTIAILEDWLREYRQKYQSVDAILDRRQSRYHKDVRQGRFGAIHMKHVIDLKETALAAAKEINADYIWFLDVDVFLTYNQTLNNLITKNETIVAALLSSVHSYTNFMSTFEDHEDELFDTIVEREELDCFIVPFVSECVLIDIRMPGTNDLTFRPSDEENYSEDHQDLIEFSYSTEAKNLPIHVCNDALYGYVMPEMLAGDTLLDEKLKLQSLKVYMIKDDITIEVDDMFKKYTELPPTNSKLEFDEIYCVNLERRPDRISRMAQMFAVLDVDYRRVKAIDGRDLNMSVLTDLDVYPVSGYRDTTIGRPMTFGEVGCTLTHYSIWEDILSNGYDEVMVLEDDVLFLPDFAANIQKLKQEITDLQLEWDLIYLDRQNLSGKPEPKVLNSSMLIEPGFSYLTTGYLLSRSGAEKLIAADPLKKLLPVDEFLPIMYDQPHLLSKFQNPHLDLFPVRNLRAYSVVSLLLMQIHERNTQDFISDTETSSFVEEDVPPFIPLSEGTTRPRQSPSGLHFLHPGSRCLESTQTCYGSETPVSSTALSAIFPFLDNSKI